MEAVLWLIKRVYVFDSSGIKTVLDQNQKNDAFFVKT